MQRSRLRLHRNANCHVGPAVPAVVEQRPVPMPGDRGLVSFTLRVNEPA
jgi:hypothetical protein